MSENIREVGVDSFFYPQLENLSDQTVNKTATNQAISSKLAAS